MITHPHSPGDIPSDVAELIEQAKEWKQRLTTEFGPSRNMQVEISLFGEGVRFYGDVEFPDTPTDYDWMSVSLALTGLVMAFDVRYLMFTSEALMVSRPDDVEQREDGTYKAPTLSQLHRTLHPSNMDPDQAWLKGDESVTQTLLVCIADTVGGRTWSLTLPFSYDLGNKVRWLPLVDDASQGPDYRSIVWGAMLLPSIIRSQYDYIRIRPEPADAMEFLFASGMTMSIADETPMATALMESGVYMVPMEEIEAIRMEQEEFISREMSEIPDTPPDDWFTD